MGKNWFKNVEYSLCITLTWLTKISPGHFNHLFSIPLSLPGTSCWSVNTTHSNIKKSNPLLISCPHLADISLHVFVSPSQQERWRKFHKNLNIFVTFFTCGLRSEIVTQLPCIKCSLHVAVHTVVPSGWGGTLISKGDSLFLRVTPISKGDSYFLRRLGIL